MFNLLDAYFVRLAKWRIFRALLILMLAGGILVGIILRDKMVVYQIPFFLGCFIFPIYVGIVIGLFNYPIFTNGTIRNQLAVGHKRKNIFFADWLTTNFFALVLFLLFAAGVLVTAKIFDAPGNVCWDKVFIGILLTSLQIVLFTTITQLFCVVLKGVKSFLAIYLVNQILIVASLGAMSFEKIPKVLLYFCPSVVCLNLNYYEIPTNPLMSMGNGIEISESLGRMTFEFLPAAGALILEITVVYIIAALYFRKTDLN